MKKEESKNSADKMAQQISLIVQDVKVWVTEHERNCIFLTIGFQICLSWR